MLSMNGYTVTLAESGEEGMSRFKEGAYDMVLTDLGMPGSSGWDVVSSIKKLGKGVPVVVMTGWPEEIIKQALNPGEVREFHLEIGVLDGAREIRAFEREVKRGVRSSSTTGS